MSKKEQPKTNPGSGSNLAEAWRQETQEGVKGNPKPLVWLEVHVQDRTRREEDQSFILRPGRATGMKRH